MRGDVFFESPEVRHLSDPDYTVMICRDSFDPSAFFFNNKDKSKTGLINLRIEGRTDAQIVEEAEAIYLIRGFGKK